MSVVVGAFELLSELGEGSFAFAYLARHRVLKDQMLAVVKQEKTQVDPHVTNFRLEAEMLGRFSHPGLPHLLDYIPSADGDLMVMSHIPGESLEKLVSSGGPVDDEHCMWMLDRVLEALDYLHGCHRVIHSDISPRNAIVDVPNHALALIDFGLSVVRPTERSVAKGGTPGFMAPELDQALPPIPQSDLYSVGKLGIYLVGGDPEAGSLPSDVHPEVRALLDKLTLRDPRRRPGGAREVRAAIRDLRRSVWKRTSTPEKLRRRA